MRTRKIEKSKKKGTFRTVVCPEAELKHTLRSMCSNLDKKARKLCPDVIHGFTRGRNPVTNAMVHVNHAYTLNFDLSDFFDSVTEAKVNGQLTKEEKELVFVDPEDGLGKRACQGLPTSPAVANIAAASIDEALLKLFKKKHLSVVYTRYADDLSFSYDDPEVGNVLRKEVPQIVRRCGFMVNNDKTHLMAASAGRRNITGVMVDDAGVHARRDLKRRLRAAHYNLKKAEKNHASSEEIKRLEGKYYGLKGACECKEPKKRAVSSLAIDGLDLLESGKRLAKLWKLGSFRIVESENPEVVDGSFIITRDPAYVLGMSTYTTGWGSCVKHPNGQYNRAVSFWYGISGTSIAALLSQKTLVFAGVERRVMKARCMLHTFVDGTVAYDKFYGDEESIEELRQLLDEKGYISTKKVKKGLRVVGNCRRGRAYFDTLRSVNLRVTQGNKCFKSIGVCK